MIVITTPTGHNGSKVLEQLLKTDEKLRVIVRDASKLSDEAKEKVEIIEGSLDDPKVLSKAYEGADALFFVIPPSFKYDDVDEYYLSFAKPTCEAIKERQVKRVVFVSGTSLGSDKNAGQMWASYLVEKELEATGAPTRILHCGTYMENLLGMIGQIKAKNQFSNAVPIDVKYPWVAVEDIADVAVPILLDKDWLGNASVGILGPEDMSQGDAAIIISSVLGKEIRYQEILGEELKSTLLKNGASEAGAQALADLCDSIKRGTFSVVKRTPENSSPTTFREWCETVFKPAFLKPSEK
jgi:uncharacterized protein YbjT (DUF2867 family)